MPKDIERDGGHVELRSDAVESGIVDDALALEADEARRAGSIGYFARLLVQVTMPHSRPTESFFERRNGAVAISMMAHPRIGLPYGTYPRLLMSWMTTEAVRSRSRELELGKSLSDFLRRLDLVVSGGPRGSITVLRRQMQRLFCTSVGWTFTGKNSELGVSFSPVEERQLWWDEKSPDQVALWKSSITLNERFFREIIDRPVPVNMVALKSLARERSPMALDIYNWLTYRMSYLRRDQLVPWELLKMQFGGDYGRTIDFRRKFLERLKLVKSVYPDVKLSVDRDGLVLSPSPSHIPFKALAGG